MRVYVVVAFIAALVTFVATWAVWKFALKHKLYPPIRQRDVHTRPTPRLGGVAILIGVVVAVVAASLLPWFGLVFQQGSQIWALLLGLVFITVLGVLDDIWDLTWYSKLGGQFLVAWWLAWAGFQFVSLPIGGVLIGSSTGFMLLTIFAIVLTMNAINFIDGLDALVTGVVLIASGTFFVYSYLVAVDTSPTNYFNLATLITAIVIGAAVGFLPFNWHPAKIFLGDSGALQLGMLMAVSAIAVTGQVDPGFLEKKSLWLPTVVPIMVPVLMLIVPLLDFSMAVVRRLMAGKSPFSADRKHLHHRMLDMGHSVVSAVFVFYAWTLVFSMFSLLLMFIRWQDLFPWAVLSGLICFFLTFRPILIQKWRQSHANR